MSKFASMLNGAVKGYQIVDEEMREGVRDKQRAQAIEDNRTDRADSKTHRDRMFKETKANNAFNKTRAVGQDERAASQENRAIAQEGRAAEAHSLGVEDRTRQQLLEQDKIAGYRLLKNGTPYPKKLNEEMKKLGMGDISIYSSVENKEAHQNALAAGGILEKLKDGDVNAVNSPESLGVINGIYKEQVQKGIGEFNSALGGTVVEKRIVGLKAAPKKGSFVAEIEVTLDNGKKFSAPLTMNRSSDPNDNVRLIEGKVAMDDLFGRYQRAQIAELNKDKIQNSYDMMYGAGEKEPGSATGKTIKDLMVFGVPKEQAIQLSTQSKTDPEAAIRSLTNAILKNNDNSDEQFSPEQAYQEARRVIMGQNSPVEAKGGATAPEQSGLPSALKYKGKTITQKSTGKQYQSNGDTWAEIQ